MLYVYQNISSNYYQYFSFLLQIKIFGIITTKYIVQLYYWSSHFSVTSRINLQRQIFGTHHGPNGGKARRATRQYIIESCRLSNIIGTNRKGLILG